MAKRKRVVAAEKTGAGKFVPTFGAGSRQQQGPRKKLRLNSEAGSDIPGSADIHDGADDLTHNIEMQHCTTELPQYSQNDKIDGEKTMSDGSPPTQHQESFSPSQEHSPQEQGDDDSSVNDSSNKGHHDFGNNKEHCASPNVEDNGILFAESISEVTTQITLVTKFN